MTTKTTLSPSELMNQAPLEVQTQEIEEANIISKRETYQQNTKSNFFEIDLGHKKVIARKWKAKDRKNFKKALKISEDIDVSIISELVINCLQNPDEALSYEELQYILIEIRKYSISDKVNFEYICDVCEKHNKIRFDLDDINRPQWEKWGIVDGIQFGNIVNSKFYNDNKDEDDDIKELAFHTVSINGVDTYTFDEIVEYFDDMDIARFDAILDKYNKMKFTIGNTKEFQCECGNKQVFEFDEIPEFFPDNWLN